MKDKYIFKSERLGFRSWTDHDLESMAAINADPEVMRFFPKTQTIDDTAKFIERMKSHFAKNQFCYFVVSCLDTQEFIGFIGLSNQTFDADFTPCIDIGWRLSRSAWGQGFATEGARRCLDYAFSHLGLDEVASIASKINTPSINVMKKIGMQKIKEFMLILKHHQDNSIYM